MHAHALLIFIKNPLRGKVKTRLAETMGEEKALKIYLALQAHTRRVALALDVDRLLYYSDFIDLSDDWPNSHFQKALQKGTDLGARMSRAFEEALSQRERAVIIGSDCPELTPDIVQKAFDRLADHDFVIGPARDGGYYLLGMREPAPSLFENMPWSTSSVFSRTYHRMERLGKNCFVLPELSDIDREEDWERLEWKL